MPSSTYGSAIADTQHIPEPVRSAVLTRIEQYGITAVALGEELLMREGWASFGDFVVDIEKRYGPEEAQHAQDRILSQAVRDHRTLQLGGRHALDEAYRERVTAENLPRYALVAAPDAEFINGVEIALGMIADRYAEPGTARGSEAQDEIAGHINDLFAKRGIPYRCENGQLVWAGDRGAHRTVVEPALKALADPRLAGARNEFEAALGHLRAGTLKDREDAIEEAAKAVESALKVLAAETGTTVGARATVRPLFDALKGAGVLPAYTDNLVQGAARIRNKLGGHGSGAQPRQVDLDEATATVSAAASAIVFLAGRLP